MGDWIGDLIWNMIVAFVAIVAVLLCVAAVAVTFWLFITGIDNIGTGDLGISVLKFAGAIAMASLIIAVFMTNDGL